VPSWSTLTGFGGGIHACEWPVVRQSTQYGESRDPPHARVQSVRADEREQRAPDRDDRGKRSKHKVQLYPFSRSSARLDEAWLFG